MTNGPGWPVESEVTRTGLGAVEWMFTAFRIAKAWAENVSARNCVDTLDRNSRVCRIASLQSRKIPWLSARIQLSNYIHLSTHINHAFLTYGLIPAYST
jgi:hypothetical protein